MIEVGSFVTRNSYNNDIVFKVIDIRDNVYYLCGTSVRLYADSYINDLVLVNGDNDVFNYDIDLFDRLDRNEYFYLPGRVLHIDGDIYLNNNALNPYKIRKNEKINNDKNNIKKKKIGNFS